MGKLLRLGTGKPGCHGSRSAKVWTLSSSICLFARLVWLQIFHDRTVLSSLNARPDGTNAVMDIVFAEPGPVVGSEGVEVRGPS